MKITGIMLATLSEAFNSPTRANRRKIYYQMNQMYEGGGRPIIEAKIKQEFSNPKAVEELSGRLVTINFMKKIIDKSAGVYNEAPTRTVLDENESDAELLEIYEDALRVNMIQKEANRHLKMYKRCLKKFYTDERGRPRLLVKPAHAYEVFNISNQDPVSPDVIAELIKEAPKPEDQIIHWWSDESFWITNGKGEVKLEDMSSLLNDGTNPIRSLPFEYRVTSSTEIDPIVEDDLLHMCISLPIVITDLFFALKYQCWSIIYTINADAQDIDMNPSSVITLKGDPGTTPSVGQIKPTVDSDKVIALIEFVVNLMLSAKGLSSGTLSGNQHSAKGVVSGVSKMLDSADVIEDKKDQQDLFMVDEADLWYKLAKNMIPYWRVNRMLATEYDSEFSAEFLVATVFKEPKALISAMDRANIGVLKIQNGLMTKKQFIIDDNPDWTETMVDVYMKEIAQEKAQAVKDNQGAIQGAVDDNGNPIVNNDPNGNKKIQSTI